MPKAKRKNRILQGAREALAYVEGTAILKNYAVHVPSDVDVAKLRKALSMSQSEFSQRFGFNPASVRDWEQGRAKPTGPIRAYLKVIEKDPQAVQRALAVA
ncbi:MAG: helix-turn-helix domain-containing protein [Pseudorhodoplanes sp.]